MILVDTSIWIGHFRTFNRVLAGLLEREQVLLHPFVLGEIACGNLKNRVEILSLLQALPAASKADDDEIIFFIEQHALMGRGLGLVDVHSAGLRADATVPALDCRQTASSRGKATRDRVRVRGGRTVSCPFSFSWSAPSVSCEIYFVNSLPTTLPL